MQVTPKVGADQTFNSIKENILQGLTLNKNLGIILLLLAAIICVVTALAHMSCIFLGPTCFEYQLAPRELVESSKSGTLLAPFATTAISAIFVIWAVYAISAAGKIKRLPLLPLAIYAISLLGIVRGLLGIQLWIRKPDKLTEFGVVSSWVWLVMGLLLLVGYIIVKQPKK